MSNDERSFICYNRGCGQIFYSDDNKEDSCQHHPGYPVFHDAYKGWSCCKKKCTDFNEFLNIKGCTKSQHSNIKPPELHKPVIDKIIQYNCKPINSNLSMIRPSFDSPQIILKPTITPLFLKQIKELSILDNIKKDDNIVVIGQSCKHNSCKGIYKGSISNDEICIYHPGTPIFHEGMKYWSCCKKKTMDFTVFLEQPGCLEGNHLWIQKDGNRKVNCRLDWHQTESNVVVSVFAKKYNPDLSCIKLNPVHLTIELYFPADTSKYSLDIELNEIIIVELSYVTMLPTKVEIKLKKKEPGSWKRLYIPQRIITDKSTELDSKENNTSQMNFVDLSDI